MLTYRELKEWINEAESIILEIHVSFLNLERLGNPRNAKEKEILEDAFFRQFYRQLRFTIIVQLSKLFEKNDRQKLNFHKFFNRLKYDKYDDFLKRRLKENRGKDGCFSNKSMISREAVNWTSELLGNSELIRRIKLVRDRHYAHTDPNRDIPIVSDEELGVLSLLALGFYNRVRKGIFDDSLIPELMQAWDVDHILKKLTEGERE